VTEPRAYGGPASFRRALTDRLKALAESTRWNLPQLQRQIAYDRLLERLYLTDDDWIVKGATALLARTSASEAPSISTSTAGPGQRQERPTFAQRLDWTSATGSASTWALPARARPAAFGCPCGPSSALLCGPPSTWTLWEARSG
jgi:hypothetical protein